MAADLGKRNGTLIFGQALVTVWLRGFGSAITSGTSAYSAWEVFPTPEQVSDNLLVGAPERLAFALFKHSFGTPSGRLQYGPCSPPVRLGGRDRYGTIRGVAAVMRDRYLRRGLWLRRIAILVKCSSRTAAIITVKSTSGSGSVGRRRSGGARPSAIRCITRFTTRHLNTLSFIASRSEKPRSPEKRLHLFPAGISVHS